MRKWAEGEPERTEGDERRRERERERER